MNKIANLRGPLGLAGHPHRLELEADWIAGWVLGRAGIDDVELARLKRTGVVA